MVLLKWSNEVLDTRILKNLQHYQISPRLTDALTHNFFLNLRGYESDLLSVEIILYIEFWILIFSQASDMWYDTLVMLSSGINSQLLVSHAITRVNNWYTQNYSVFHF